MKGVLCQPLMNYTEDDDYEEIKEAEETTMKDKQLGRELDEIKDTATRFQCMSLHKRESTKRGEEVEKYDEWRQEQKSRAARLEKQLKARWELEELIEEQLNRFHAHNRSMVPTQLKDVAQFLMPKWSPAQELASLSWLGGWRPSSLLDLLRGLARSSSSLSYTVNTKSPLAQLIHDIRIEESIIDEEMSEIQATCILYLPFSPLNNHSGGAALGCVYSEFNKIERVIIKAQQLRSKALEMVVKKVLSQTDAAEFLVAFSGIQEAIHQFAEQQKARKGPVTMPVHKPRKGPRLTI